MSWAKEGSATEVKTRQLAESLRRHVATMLDGRAEEIEEDSNASGGFVDGCDGYAAFAFVAEIGGRQYYITAEDVTVAE